MFRRMNQNSSETKENIDAVEEEREKRQINLNLSSFLTNFPYFTRLPEPQIVNLYVFSLVFALMGNLEGKFFSYCPTTLSKSLAEVRFASLVEWA